jgi:LmbE family N-acetylglucosaminyl deacetylase
MKQPKLDRVLIVAPHPDDDVIACGGLIQRAGLVRVLIVTDGENNPWPQRFASRTLFITKQHRRDWASMRRREALAALARLGVKESSVRFLALPDQRIANLARRRNATLTNAIESELRDFKPTLVIAPSMFDAHCDHRAVAWFAHQATHEVDIATYVVHGGAPASRMRWTIELSPYEQAAKYDAVSCHASQLILSRDRFLSYVKAVETFYASEDDVVRVESWMETMMTRLRHVGFVVSALIHRYAPPSPATATEGNKIAKAG